MAGNIQGITLEIGGDTAPLDKALKNVNRTTNALQKELREIDKALKLDPANTELLAQKQKLLKDQITGTKDKLDALKAAKAQADEAMANGTEVNQAQYRKLEREIVQTENSLNTLEKTAQSVGTSMSRSIEQAGRKIADTGAKIESAGKAVMPVSAAVTGVGVAAVAAFDAVDSGADIAIAKTGAVGDAAKTIESAYKSVAGSVEAANASLEDVGSTVGEVNTRFDFTGDKLEQCSKDFLKFARVNDTDVTGAVQLVSRAMGDASIPADEYADVLDALTVAGQKSGISIETLAGNITKYGAPMRALGYSTAESIAIFSSWEKAGVNTEIAFSGMKKAISNFMAQGKDAKTEFKNLVKGVQDGSVTAQQAMEIFGTKAGPDLVDAIQEGRFAFDDMLAAVEGSKGALDGTFDTMVDGVDEAKAGLKQVQVAFSDVGSVIVETFTPILLALVGALKSACEWFGALSPTAQRVVVVLGGIVAALGPALITIGKISQGVGALTQGFGQLAAKLAGGGLSGIGAALSGIALPIAGVIAAVAALALAWQTNFAGIREHVAAAWEAIGAILQSIKDFAVGVLAAIRAAWEADFGGIQEVVTAFVATVTGVFGAVFDTISSVLTAISQLLQGNFSGAMETLKGLFSRLLETVRTIFTSILTAITTVLSKVVTGIVTWGASILSSGVNAARNFLTNVSNFFSQLPGRIAAFLTQAISKIIAWGAQMVSNGISAASNFISNVASTISQLPGRIWTFLSQAVQKIIEWGTQMISNARAKMGEVVSAVVGKLQEIPGQVLSIGRNIVEGLWSGISGAVGWIKEKVGGFARSILDGMKSALGIHSPSRAFRDEIGKQIPAGVALGVKENEWVAIKTVEDMSKHILDKATAWVDDKKLYNKLTLQQEKDFWEDLKSMEGLQTDELAEIDKKIFTAKQAILDEEQKALEEYTSSVSQRADALSGFAGIFDNVVKETETSGKELLENLRGQVNAFAEWQKSLAVLEEKGAGADLLAELREQGPKALGEIKALTQLSDEEIQEYSGLYAQKTMAAMQQAIDEMGAVTIPVAGIADAVGELRANAAYAVAPTAQLVPMEDQTSRDKIYVDALTEAITQGLAMVGNAIFDAIPKQIELYLDSTRMARAAWDAFDGEGDRHRRMFAPSREDIASIAMSVMPRKL